MDLNGLKWSERGRRQQKLRGRQDEFVQRLREASSPLFESTVGQAELLESFLVRSGTRRVHPACIAAWPGVPCASSWWSNCKPSGAPNTGSRAFIDGSRPWWT